MGAEGFWGNPEAAQQVFQRLKAAKALVEPFAQLVRQGEDLKVLLECSRGEGDAAMLAELARDAEAFARGVEQFETKTLFSDENDVRNAYVVIHAGAGGVDACDWVEILYRMYLRWAERNGFKFEEYERLPAEEAGLRHVTVRIEGPYAFGSMKSEMGVHRLVRISPFDANKRRHTSFASVDVTPEFEESAIVINERDLKVDTYRSSGAGGQHVNVTDSAVRITHIPTGVIVACQNERSQILNRKVALKLLYAKLYRMREAEREADLKQVYGEKGEISWGYQIRSYVLAPYQLIKDHRTEVETGDVSSVLDGDIARFQEAYLRKRAKKGK